MSFPSPTPLSLMTPLTMTTTTISSRFGFFYDHMNSAIRWASTANPPRICRKTGLWSEKSSATMTEKCYRSRFPHEIASDLYGSELVGGIGGLMVVAHHLGVNTTETHKSRAANLGGLRGGGGGYGVVLGLFSSVSPDLGLGGAQLGEIPAFVLRWGGVTRFRRGGSCLFPHSWSVSPL
ncbi:hypothetical protein TIFTF001_022886 [Ficus carica]|uniref:Uncharacterized protein n=1 Tax=Ficus carica TaxID=3494 RepID=A0AA88AKT0_FICCA|nr:hypothetical protein TIFTF001_022886 [Ficus carica]